MFRPIKRIYIFKETEYWILIIRTTIYRTFTLLLKHPPIYIKKGVILEGCQKPSYLEYYLKKVKKWHRNKNKNDKVATI